MSFGASSPLVVFPVAMGLTLRVSELAFSYSRHEEGS